MNISGDLKNHVTMLEGMSSKERLTVIRDIEYNIAAHNNNILFTQNLKENEKKLRISSDNLNLLFNAIGMKEDAIDDFYREMKKVLVNEKLTSSEFQNLKRETHMVAKINKFELDDLLSIASSELKMYNKCVYDLEQEKAAQQYISNLIEKAKNYLIEAKLLEIENIEKLKKKANITKHEREAEIIKEDIKEDMIKLNIKSTSNKDHRFTKGISSYNDKNNKNTKRKKFIYSSKKKLFLRGITNKNKKILKPKSNSSLILDKSRDKHTARTDQITKLTTKLKSKVKNDEITSYDNNEKPLELKNNISKEDDYDTNVGCCKKATPGNTPFQNKKISIQDMKRKSNEIFYLNMLKRRKFTHNTPITKDAIPNSELITQKFRTNSKSKTSKSRSESKKDRKKRITNKHKININDNNFLLNNGNIINKSSPLNIHGDEKKIYEINGKKKAEELESIAFKSKNISNRGEIKKYKGIDSSMFLNENEILQKKKDNLSKYESNFPTEDMKKSTVINTGVDKSTIDIVESKYDEDNFKRIMERFKLQRLNRLKIEEQDRIIIKTRDFEIKRANEKERLDKKLKLKELDDHKYYLREIESKKVIRNKDMSQFNEDEQLNVKAIEKQSKVNFDYQKLVSESRIREQPLINFNLYNPNNLSNDLNKMKKKISFEENKNLLNHEINLCQIEPNYEKEVAKVFENDITIVNEKKYENEYNNMGNILLHEDEIQNEFQTNKIQENIKTNESQKINEEVINHNLIDCDINNEKKTMDIKEFEKDETSESDKVNKGHLEDKHKMKENYVEPLINSPGPISSEIQDGLKEELMVNDTRYKSKKFGCFSKRKKILRPIKNEVEVNKYEITLSDVKDIQPSDMSSEKETSETSITEDKTDDPPAEVDINVTSTKEIDSDEDESLIPENEMCNPKFWKKNVYYVESKSLLEKKIACIIRAKPGSIPKRKLLKCELISSSDEVPYLDKREDYASYIFKIYPLDKEIDSKINFDVPWFLAIPYYLPETSSKHPLIMQVNDEQNCWTECVTCDTIFDNFKQNDFKFVETRIQKPFGTYAVVTYLNKDRTVVNKEGTQMTSTSDRNIVLSVPPDAIRISINTSLQVTALDQTFWNEIREKHEKSVIDGICTSSSVVEIEAKKKKLASPATLTLTLPKNVTHFEERFIKKKITVETEFVNSKIEDEKSLIDKRILNPFQKTLSMPVVNSASNVQDVHFLSYINEEERWNIIENPELNYDKVKEQMHVELPFIQSSKYILLKSKRKTSDESITKAAKMIDNELCVRNCVIALLQSNKMSNDFALIVSLKKYFQNQANNLQEEGYAIDTSNKLAYVELKERQVLTMKFIGNIKSLIPERNETEFAFHSLFPNTQKFRVKEIDSFSQKAVTSFRGYLDLYTKSLVKKPVHGLDGKIRKNQAQYTWIEENTMICHLLISIKKGKIPKVPPFYNFKFQFKDFHRCLDIIKKVSSRIGLNWWELGIFLNITETRMHSIKLHNQDKGLNKMAEQMLIFWLKGCETIENKYDLLTAALKNCGRYDIVDRLQKPQERHLLFGC